MTQNKAMLMAFAVILLAFFTAPSYVFYADNEPSSLWGEPEKADPIPAVPSEAEILEAINNNLLPEAQTHPYIHAKKSKLCEIKSNLQSGDEYTKIFYDKVKADADTLLKSKVMANYGAVNQGHYHVQSRILNLMITYYIDGEQKYLDRALLEFYELKKIEKWTADSYLDCTASSAAIAICYDWLYDFLTEDEKAWCITSIKEKCLDLAYEYYKYPSRLNAIMQANDNMYMVLGESSYNQATCNNSNLLVSALAVAPQFPEYAAYIIYKNLYNIRMFFYEVGAGGGLNEPIAYFGYKGVKSINMLSAINGAFGTIYGYGSAEGFRTMAYYPIFMYGAGPFAFGDTSPKKASFDANPLYFVAKHSKNKELLGLIKEKLPNGDCALPVLWYEKGEMANALHGANLPLDKHLYPTYKTLNVAVFRNCWDLENGFFAGLYAGTAQSAHNSAVSGAFCIDVWGERFITPIAKGSYSYPGYFDTAVGGERWAWYETRAEGNCCLVINPSEDAGQDITKKAVIDNFESSSGSAYAISDLSEVYKDYVSFYKRGLSTENDRSKIVLQDEVKMLSPSKIHWSINCASNAKIIDQNTALLSVGEKLLVMKIYANVDFTLGIMPSEKLSTSPLREGQLSYPDYRKIFFDAENVSKLHVRAEFIPIKSSEQIPEGVPEFVPMNEWTNGNAVIPEPILEKICINGENIDGFEKNIYNYDIDSENGEITFTAANGCTAALLNKNSFTAEITVLEGIRKSQYTLTFWGGEPQPQNALISRAQFLQDKNECKMRALIKAKPPENTKAILAAFSNGTLCYIKIIDLENFSGKQIAADFSHSATLDSAKAFLLNKFSILTPGDN